MRIIDLRSGDGEAIQQCAALMVGSLLCWPDLPSATEEVGAAVTPGKICRMAVDEAGQALGWTGARPEYDGKTWELHPLIVRADSRRQGIGRALVADLEQRVREQGGATLYLGTDDEDGGTTLSGVDLYPNLFQRLAEIRNLRDHPYEFYQKVGFIIVGAIPDANGFGKPDILMAKRVGEWPPAPR